MIQKTTKKYIHIFITKRNNIKKHRINTEMASPHASTTKHYSYNDNTA